MALCKHLYPQNRGLKRSPMDDAVNAALARLPEVFDKYDLLAVLDFAPRPATLHRALNTLREDGVLAVEREGAGKRPIRYRKVGTDA
jgi:hypothetical protein